jgi:uncharacterized protein YkwD
MKIPQMAVRALCFLLLAAIPGLPSLPEPAGDLGRLELQVHRAVNKERARRKLPALAWNDRLSAEARRHAVNMARYRFFAHEDPRRGDLADRLDSSGIDWNRCAENLYEEKGQWNNLAASAVKAWLGSPGHRRNMLDSTFSEAGVGAAVQKDGTVLIVQNFVWR